MPPLVAVDEAGARKLVEAWLAAQNTGDFAAYAMRYGPKLEGLKRRERGVFSDVWRRF